MMVIKAADAHSSISLLLPDIFWRYLLFFHWSLATHICNWVGDQITLNDITFEWPRPGLFPSHICRFVSSPRHTLTDFGANYAWRLSPTSSDCCRLCPSENHGWNRAKKSCSVPPALAFWYIFICAFQVLDGERRLTFFYPPENKVIWASKNLPGINQIKAIIEYLEGSNLISCESCF